MESTTRRPAWLIEEFAGESIPDLAVLAANDGLDAPKAGFRPGADKTAADAAVEPPGKSPSGRPSKKKKRPTTRLARQMAIKYRISMTLDMRNTLMDCFLRCRRKGLMNIEKPAELKLVWTRVCAEMKEKYPGYAWTDTKIIAEYKTCKKRWQHWLTMSRRPGSTMPDENGLVQAPESSWQWLLDKLPDAKWMRTEPLGYVKVYQAVFNDADTAVGGSEAEVSEDDNLPEMIAPGEADDSLATRTMEAPPRERQCHPDLNPRVSEESDTRDSLSPSSAGCPNQSTRRLRRGSEAEVEALDKLATSISRPMGSDDIIAAVNVIQKRLGSRLTVEEKAKAFRALANNPLNAVVLLQVESDDEKLAFLRGFLS
ncbi:hypothetical protein GGR50DRAFT_616702 [Xylaria sp. CBS 124048]|nr:hypothetical protein GGR50DRAFT_616702 [Xylaria sp. CBS 124048]